MRTSTLQRKIPMRRSKPKREKGLGHKLEVVMGFYRPPGHKLPTLLRSEQHRRNVVALGCLVTGGPAQACHANITKGTALKACDSLCFPLSPELHRQHDQGGILISTEQAELVCEWIRGASNALQKSGSV
ncbi:hypothetical protein [Bordetella pseudohinzii]|nr:hypothetical protein [Bordetella pseudohinzii]